VGLNGANSRIQSEALNPGAWYLLQHQSRYYHVVNRAKQRKWTATIAQHTAQQLRHLGTKESTIWNGHPPLEHPLVYKFVICIFFFFFFFFFFFKQIWGRRPAERRRRRRTGGARWRRRRRAAAATAAAGWPSLGGRADALPLATQGPNDTGGPRVEVVAARSAVASPDMFTERTGSPQHLPFFWDDLN
jgi:hypothetical protein